MTTEKEIIQNILELYKGMPYLWNKSDLNYMNRNIRNKGFNVLLRVYKTYDKNATIKTLKKKIDNLRTNYRTESKKVKASRESGADEIYQPTIWYYDYLSFLDSTTTKLESKTTICRPARDILHDDENSTQSSVEADTQSITSTAGTSNRFKKMKKEASNQKEILEKTSESLNSTEKDWEIEGKSIGLQLRDITNPEQHAIARKLISDVIFYGVMNKLSENSVIDLRTPSTHFSWTSCTENDS